MKKTVKTILFTLSALVAITACKKEPDTPPVAVLESNDILTLDSLRNWQMNVGGEILIEDTLSVFGVVTMSEANGNIYKNIYLQDASAAINVRFTSSSDLKVGDSIRIALNGTTLSEFNGVIQLSNVDPDKNIVVQAADKNIAPQVVTIADLAIPADPEEWAFESKLVKLENIQFKTSELGKTYADAANQSSENRYFEDFEGNTLYIRTSGFADFAGDLLPEGSGSMVCIASEYNGDLQLILRSPQEALMSGTRGPGELLVKDFNDNSVTSGGWIVQQVIGTHAWETGSLGGWSDRPYAVISNFDSGNTACESWLISPSLNLSASSGASFSFDNAYNYGGPALEVLVSTNYPGTGDPTGFTWEALSPTLSSGGWDFVNSGNIDLSAYLSSNVHIAFKYTGSDSDGSTWEIDNIIING